MDAATFAFAYPAADVAWDKLPCGTDLTNPACLVPLAGAFIYFNQSDEPCAISGICGLVDQLDEKTRQHSMLQFAAPIRLKQGTIAALGNRLQNVTLAPLLALGARKFA